MNIKFRKYTNSDYQDLYEMVSALYNEDLKGQPMNEFKVIATIKEFIQNPQKLSIVMFEKNDEAIGYAILVYFWSNEYGGNIINVDELYVKQEFRNQGICTCFFEFIEEIDNIAALQLETTHSNERVFNYYKGLGFTNYENKQLIKVKAYAQNNVF